ncbi:MAG: 50S rRNA methyltransferase [Chloroflexi bacterium]|nr:50S rRNA methyltransferase [Chloroflexota bacterium]
MTTFQHDSQTLLATCAPDYADHALGELASVAVAVREEVAPGVLLAESERGFLALAKAWRSAGPIFIRHVNPVHSIIEGVEGSLFSQLTQAVETDLLPHIAPDVPFSIQTRMLDDALSLKPFDISKPLSTLIEQETGAALDVRDPRQVISVAVVSLGDRVRAWVGLSDVRDNLSDWAGGVRRFKRSPEQVSRSEFKLLEAFETFQIALPPRGRALDLGAAPGGWTRILRLAEQFVIAVDPGDLHPSILADKGVGYRRMTAQQYLQEEPDEFDLIVNDMRMDARDSARLMVDYAKCLYPHGAALMSLKLTEDQPLELVEGAFAILDPVYQRRGARQFFHNRNEIMVYLTLR